MYFDVGIPAGDRTILDTGVLLTPKFVGISTNAGSPGGSVIILNVQGIGWNDTIKNIIYTANGDQTLCSSLKVIAYG